MISITLEEFQQKYKEQRPDADKWANLEQNKVHKIGKFRKISTSIGEFIIITLEDGRYFWACSGLQTKLNSDDKKPQYLVSLGKKQCSKSSHMLWSFQVIDA